MPRYEFLCETCGSFECWRAFSEASEPMPCPECGTTSKRIYSTPGLVKTPVAMAKARQRVEKSAYEPDVIRREQVKNEGEPRPVPLQRSHGRPWQISH